MILMKKTLLTLGLIGLLFPTTIHAEPIAKVNDVIIEQDDFNQSLKNKYGYDYLSQRLLLPILEQTSKNKDALSQQADQLIDELKQQFDGDENALTNYLLTQGYGTLKEYRESVYQGFLLDDVLTSQVPQDDESFKTWFDNAYRPAVELSHIMVETPEEAEQLIEQIATGSDFKELAKTKSIDKLTAAKGGYLGRFDKDQLPEAFRQAIDGYENNQLITTPVVTEDGIHILFLINNGEPLDFEKDQEALKNLYISDVSANSEFQKTVIQSLLDKATIEVYDDTLAPLYQKEKAE